ncbi:globin [Roseibacillus persicicus]|uniref:globin domain-containing protein n=1 Tax=Roseibacillus persicicus TaxID=454148 RepID=UPI00280FBCC1|nr:globin [Roseibacillus persicicus]MDQ8189457.1 globin [Roseibacillus persicicus]
MDEEKIWSEIGSDGFERITAAFYQGVRRDSLLGPMYPADDWEGAEHRLALFLKFRFGQDQTYLEERGHPRLRMRHMPFQIGEAERDRWLDLMASALESENVAPDTREAMMTFFSGVADFMRNR